MTRLVALILLAAPALAQAQALRIDAGLGPVEIAAFTHHGYPAYPVATLSELGAQVDLGADGARVHLFGDTLRLFAFSPFLTAGGRPVQLAHPVYRYGGVLYVPAQLFTDFLPSNYASDLSYRDGALRLASPRTAPAQTAARPPGKRIVVIDPGHGGRDPGVVGPTGLREKDVTLAISRRLADLLRAQGYEVHMTRDRDVFVPLMERAQIANRLKSGRPASIFVSIHANSARTRARGFETFFLSEARTEDERRVAEMENAAVRFDENGQEDQGLNHLDLILNHLRNDHYMHASHALAATIQRQFARVHPGPNRGVKQAGLLVLVGAFMPAVLVEPGFISHPDEARLLGTAAFQQRLAEAVADAIAEFFDAHEHLWAEVDLP